MREDEELPLLTLWTPLHCRNIIHGSDGPETAKDEIALWFKPEEILSYKKETDKWLYE